MTPPTHGASATPPVRRGLALATLAILLAALGCAHETQRFDGSAYTGPGKAYFEREELEFPDVPDPVEPMNRAIAGFNRGLLLYLVDPLFSKKSIT